MAKSTEEREENQQSQLSSARASYKLTLAERDATIAKLKDNLDEAMLKMEEQEEGLSNQVEDLKKQLAESQEKLQSQVRLTYQ